MRALIAEDEDDHFELINRHLSSAGQGRTQLDRVSDERETIQYWSAGHPAGFVIRCRGDTVRELGSFDLVLELPAIWHSRCRRDFSPAGDTVMLDSDGITETQSKIQGLSGEERLKCVVANLTPVTAGPVPSPGCRPRGGVSRQPERLGRHDACFCLAHGNQELPRR